MATIKSYTDLEQSKVLAEILPLESADMEFMFLKKDNSIVSKVPFVKDGFEEPECCYLFIPCWSLAALLNIIKTYSSRLEIALKVDKNYNIFAVSGDFVFRSFDDFPDGFDTLVNACVAMIEKLNELKLL